MPTSVPGSSRAPLRRANAGFTLLELLVVITVIALSTGLSILALRDSTDSQLEREAARLAALLDAARVESRASGRPITWRPLTVATTGRDNIRRDFVFEPPIPPESMGEDGRSGVPSPWPHQWLAEDTRAEVLGAPRLVLGPEPLIAAQRVRLRLGERQLVVATDGLRPFRVEVQP